MPILEVSGMLVALLNIKLLLYKILILLLSLRLSLERMFGIIFANLVTLILNWTLLLKSAVQVFTLKDKDEMKEKATFWSLCFLALGGGSFFCQLIQVMTFNR